MPQDGKKENMGFWTAVGFAWELGFLIVSPILLFVFGGLFVDSLLDTRPWFAMGGLFLSMPVGALSVWIKIKRIVKLSKLK